MGSRIKQIGKGKFEITIEAGKDPLTGRRKRIYRRVEGRQRDAEDLCAELLQQLKHGSYIEPSKTTLAEYLREWLNAYASNKAPSTYAGYKIIVGSHLIPHLGEIPLTKLQPLQIQKYYNQKLKDGRRKGKGGLSAATIRRHHALLREALQHAVKWNLIHRNPADQTEPPATKRPEIYPLNDEQIKLLLNAATGSRDENLITVALYTGLRRGEILALNWDNVDMDSKRLWARHTINFTTKEDNENGYIIQSIGKSKGARREIHLPDIVVSALDKQKKMLLEEKMRNRKTYDKILNLVFPNEHGKPLEPSTLARRFKTIVKNAGLENTRFHDLRHTHATTLLKLDIHPKIVQERLGHETIGITMDTYTHVLPGMQKEVANKLNEYLSK